MKKITQSLYFWPLVLSAVVIGLDQLTKQTALAAWAKEILPMKVIDGFFAFTFAWNKGVSFSFLGDVNHTLTILGFSIPSDAYMPVLLSLVALLAVGIFLKWLPQEEGLGARLAIGAIIGGALGNMVDRLLHGAVVDFILFYWHPYYFPAFNVADVAISCGVGLLILLHFVHTFKNRDVKQKEKEPLS